MSFVYPAFLFALLAIAVPIIIHLFNFRKYRKVFFSDVRFLRSIEQQTKNRNQLKHLLVLLMRILAIACLVLAFAQPVVPTGNDVFNPVDRRVSIYLDNSFSMDAEGEQGGLLEVAKNKALEVADAYQSVGEMRFYSNDLSSSMDRALSIEELGEEVSRANFSPAFQPLSQVVKRASAESDDMAHDIYVLGDMQRSSTDLSALQTDSNTHVYLVPIPSAETGNLFVDSLWFGSPVRLLGLDEMTVRVRNLGDQRKEDIPVRLTLNGSQKAIANISIEAGSYEDVKLSFKADRSGYHFGKISILDHPIVYDDEYLFSFNIAAQISVLEIIGNEASKAIKGVFGNDPTFRFEQVAEGAVDYSAFPDHQLIVLNELEKVSSGLVQELASALEKGASVLCVPSMKEGVSGYDELLLVAGGLRFGEKDTAANQVDGLNLESDLFKNVFVEWKGRIDLPKVANHYPISIPTRSDFEVQMRLQDGSPVLVSSKVGLGKMHVFGSGFSSESSQLARHALIVPTLYNIGLYSQQGFPPYAVLGRDDVIRIGSIPASVEVLSMNLVDGEEKILPEIQRTSQGVELRTYGQLSDAGHYVIMADEDTVGARSFNYNRKESDVSLYNTEELEAAVEANQNLHLVDAAVANLGSAIKEINEGKRLWKLFLVLALLFLLFETLLIRFLR